MVGQFAGTNRTGGDAVNTETLTANKTLYGGSPKFQRITASGADRTVTLPAEEKSHNLWFLISNVGASQAVVVADDAAATVISLAPGQAAIVACEGSAWTVSQFGFSGSTTRTISLADNLAAALDITEGSNSYLKFVTTNSGEKVQLGKDLDLPAARSITMLDNSSAALTISEGANSYLKFITTNSGEKIQLGVDLDLPAARGFTLLDNTAAALNIKEAANSYLKFDTTNSSELITAGVNFTVATDKTLAVTTVDKLTAGGVIVPTFEEITIPIELHASRTEQNLFVARRAVEIVNIDVVPHVAQAITGTVVKVTGTATPDKATTPMHTADGINFNGTIHTVQAITLTVTTADLRLVAGERIGLDLSAALTSGSAIVTIRYKYI